MFVNRTRGVVWATSGVLALVGCDTPSQKTDLRPAGPPEVLSVLVLNDAAGNLAEGATFCKTGDAFRPGLVNTIDGVGHQLCPDDLSMGADELTDANPQNWYVRVMFDELLDPSIEDLVPILDENGMDTGTSMGTLANTQPFTLQCQSVTGGTLVDIPYDGYYSPAGNKITWPVGPSLVIVPNSPALVATQSECQLTLKTNIKDEDGNPVPSDQLGPYKFKIAPVQVIAADTTPADGDSVDPIAAGVDLTFNTNVTGVTASLVQFTPDPGNDYKVTEAPNEYFFGGDFATSASYMWTLMPGAMIKDQCGKVTTVTAPSVDTGDAGSFKTNDLMFTGIAPFDTQANAKPSSKVVLKFNQYMNPSTLATTEFSLTGPSGPVAGATASYDSSLNLIVDAELHPATMYTFTLKAGATIDDCPGGEWDGTTCTSTKSATFTNTADQVVHFTTAALALTGTTPKDNATSALLNPFNNKTAVIVTFNFDVKLSSITASEFSASSGTWTVNTDAPYTAGGTSLATSPNQVEFDAPSNLAPGDYTFTLKMGATIDDLATPVDTYTQAADQVIHFSVAAPAPAGPACY